MNNELNRKRAIQNVEQSKGFMCPTCTSLVSAGYEYCPNCGASPYDSISNDYDNGWWEIVSTFFMFFISFFLYGFVFAVELWPIGNKIAIFMASIMSLITISTLRSKMKISKKKGYGTFKKFRYYFFQEWILFFSIVTILIVLKIIKIER